MSFPPSPNPPNGWSLWFITESEITKGGWDTNASLELCSVLWQYLIHHGLLPYVVKKKKMEPISEWLFPSWGALIHSLVPILWILWNIWWGECGFISDLCFHHIQNSQVTLKLGACQIQILVVPLVGYICPFITLPSFSSCVKWWKYYADGLLCGLNEQVCRRGLSFDRYSINIQLVLHLFNPSQTIKHFQCSKCRWHF